MPEIEGRTFFAHSAHNTIGVSTATAVFEPAAPVPHAARVVLASGNRERRPDEPFAVLQDLLNSLFDLECTRRLDELDKCDCLILPDAASSVDAESLLRIERYCRDGGGVVALGTAAFASEQWPSLAEIMAERDDHCGRVEDHLQPAPEIEPAAADHPILSDVGSFSASAPLGGSCRAASAAVPLLTGTCGLRTAAVAWARSHADGRLFWTTLGHPHDFHRPSFIRLVLNAVFWTAR